MQSKQESVTKEEESLTRFGWNGKMERERENDERREEERRGRGKEVFALVIGVLDVLFFVFAENESKRDSNRDMSILICSFLLDSSP